jgi:tetratricopeptide (TPR) repeat protein
MKNRNSIYTLCLCLLTALSGCKKDFLDQRPNKALLVPTTVNDMRALLDNTSVFNFSPGLPFISDGDFYATETGYNSYGEDMERNSYTWAEDIFAGVQTNDWNLPYQQVFYANVVLEGLDQLPGSAAADKEAVRGTALFFRALAFYNLLTQFGAVYHAGTAGIDLGIPLRLHADVTLREPRSTVTAAYAQVLADLSGARVLLPAAAAYKSRPTIAAVQALRARVYLSMGDYVNADRFADSALSLHPNLLDYNTLSKTATRPFPRPLPNGNDEVIFYSVMNSYSFNTSASETFADSSLFKSYQAGDLRRDLFFRAVTPGNYKFKGNYAGTLQFFTGLATDELYLTRAECRARAGNAAGAMEDLNTLLAARWTAGSFIPFTAADAGSALRLALAERRKELLGRCLRWTDLRRLNTDPQFAVTLKRQVAGISAELAPGSKRYVFPIPAEEVRLGGLVQNER